MAAYVAIFLSSIAIILFTIILIRFKHLFNQEQIVKKTRIQMNKMIANINKETNRDLELINDSTRRLRALLTDSDRKMESFREATQRLRDMISEADRLSRLSGMHEVYSPNQGASNIKPVGYNSQTAAKAYAKNKQPSIDPEATYKPSDYHQKSLFEEDETTITPDGAAYKEVPLITTKMYDEQPANRLQIKITENEGQISAQKTNQNYSAPVIRPVSEKTNNVNNLSEKVYNLFNQGMQVEDIATTLSCSIAEVQFIIDMN